MKSVAIWALAAVAASATPLYRDVQTLASPLNQGAAYPPDFLWIGSEDDTVNVASFSGELPQFLLDFPSNPVTTPDPDRAPFYFDITGSALHMPVFGGAQAASRVKLFPEAGTAWLMLIGMVLAAAGVRLPQRRRVK
jgi:hypothetical protein